MKLHPIDQGQRPQEATEAGLKVKSHVKAGLGNAVFNNPTLQPITALGVQPIRVCG